MSWVRHRRRAAVSMAFALTMTGCHKTKLAYVPPAPPISATASHAATQSRRAVSQTREPGAKSHETMAPVDSRWRPVSTEVGMASWYGPPYHNHQGADGTVFDENAMTAAHRTLPMGTTVRVTNLATEESVVVRITDRGPFVQGRTLDLSLAAAKAIGVYRMGVAKVKVEAFAHEGADPEGRWCVQIGVFIDVADAIQLKNDLLSRYQAAKVIEFAGPTGYWVRINPAQPDRNTAARIAETIHLPDAEAYLVRTN